ncbi:MAG: DNA recombination protein RmuC [Planctomycetes bacterium]|nr:DNA recombination protein RmuC [Planctomycetota bacterium]
MDYLSLGMGILIGCFLGGIAVFAFIGRKTGNSSELEIVRLQTQLEEQKKSADAMLERLNETFAKISQETVDKNSSTFLQLAETKFAPLKEQFAKTEKLTRELEAKRIEAYAGLREATKNILDVNRELQHETKNLETALRRPDHRGKWGEVGLRNVVEFAGMAEYCDFTEQTTTQGEQNLRPDMLVKLPGGGQIVVDSKLPLEHYLNAIDEPEKAGEHLIQHLACVTTHIKALSKKEYWNQFEHTPNFVVMFVNVESALVAALERDPELHEKAMKNNVLLTSPATLLALLQATAYGWRQESIAQNAEEIAKAGQELFERLTVFRDRLETVGIKIQQAAGAFNKAQGSFVSRLAPGAKTLSDLHASGGRELKELEKIDQELVVESEE